ncbi:dolichyl-diphosphooligosaccharide--protein glycosyltransferase subunit 1A [Mercurialis annua]|uniref:dolichyl-diphosphooligosaccharide--protein glycosyltransferase subunit 1A n=1 Tax=Mercurialis annua TaxID=3986 RepID=UPI0021607149|nr:dolichyl-diphosphooligosaccharide--protein glycosyltransferase subunit 1A [Mercurialis annua]
MEFRGLRFSLVALTIAILSTTVLSDLIISRVDRRIDLTSQIVRITSTLKVENAGSASVSEFLLIFPEIQAKKLSYLSATPYEGKGKTRKYGASLPIEVANPKGMPPALNSYSVSLPKPLSEGQTLTLDVLAVFTHALQPFPEKISQADIQLVLLQDSAHYLSPYAVKSQSLSVKLPDARDARVESYTKIENTNLHDSEIKYGPYENLPPYSYSPIAVHFEANQPFAVARELVREIEISHWGNVQVTEHYIIVHGGAKSKGEFSRLDYQARPNIRGASAIKHFIAKLPPRAHSIYYRDEIGNISTSQLWADSRKTKLLIEPRYPMFGGWRTTFTIGYSLPLPDFLFESDGKRFLNITFASPMNELVIDNLIVKVVLPEGSRDLSASIPFPVNQREETKISHLDVAGRPVVVLEKTNAVPEHNQYFQVYYRFNKLSMLREPFMLIAGFFFLFVAGIVCVHVDWSISKSSASYLAKLQWDEVRATVQQIESIINQCLATHEKLEASLRDLSRVGDIQACKTARKTADALLKEHAKELKPLLAFLQSSSTATHILPKVEELVAKERELQERLIVKHAIIVDCYEKKLGAREIENRAAPHQQKVVALRQEVEGLLDYIDEI